MELFLCPLFVFLFGEEGLVVLFSAVPLYYIKEIAEDQCEESVLEESS